MTIAYYITHPQVNQDPGRPVPQWDLSPQGRARLQALADAPWVKSLTVLHASEETKAVETAQILADISGARIITHAQMHENDRSATGYLLPPEFEGVADAFFAEPTVSVRGWERAIDAQKRIVAAVDHALYTSKPTTGAVAFCGHGAVGTLLLCYLVSLPIGRHHDQPPGGGNVFAFDTAARRVLFGWTALEHVASRSQSPSSP